MTKESPTGVRKGTIKLMSNSTQEFTHYASIPLINEYLNDTEVLIVSNAALKNFYATNFLLILSLYIKVIQGMEF